jgi:hypothetical protein
MEIVYDPTAFNYNETTTATRLFKSELQALLTGSKTMDFLMEEFSFIINDIQKLDTNVASVWRDFFKNNS